MKNLGYKMRAAGGPQGDLESAGDSGRPHREGPHRRAGGSVDPVADVRQPGPAAVGSLGTRQAALPSDDEVGVQDAEALARQETERERRSAEMIGEYTGRFDQAEINGEIGRTANRGCSDVLRTALPPCDDPLQGVLEVVQTDGHVRGLPRTAVRPE